MMLQGTETVGGERCCDRQQPDPVLPGQSRAGRGGDGSDHHVEQRVGVGRHLDLRVDQFVGERLRADGVSAQQAHDDVGVLCE